MSSSYALPAPANPLSEELPQFRAVLEEQWRRQAAGIIELSFDALAPARDQAEEDGSHLNGLEVTARLIAAARQQLQETEAALDRVDDGTYGLCGGCGKPITPERLEILPAARYCVACQGRRTRSRRGT